MAKLRRTGRRTGSECLTNRCSLGDPGREAEEQHRTWVTGPNTLAQRQVGPLDRLPLSPPRIHEHRGSIKQIPSSSTGRAPRGWLILAKEAAACEFWVRLTAKKGIATDSRRICVFSDSGFLPLGPPPLGHGSRPKTQKSPQRRKHKKDSQFRSDARTFGSRMATNSNKHAHNTATPQQGQVSHGGFYQYHFAAAGCSGPTPRPSWTARWGCQAPPQKKNL